MINLSPDKRAVMDGVYKALREGGEFYFSDVYCDRRLPQATREHDVLLGEVRRAKRARERERERAVCVCVCVCAGGGVSGRARSSKQ